MLLDSYEYYINSFEDFTLKGLYTNINDALKEYETIYPDIIISDISLPGGLNGIEAIKTFKNLDNAVKIILISVHDDVDRILNSIENKADGYLTKPITKNKLLDALQALNRGGSPLSPNVSKLVMTILRQKQQKNLFDKDLFSEREIEILSLFTEGYTYNNIAESLFISHSTVNFHIQNIYDKLNVRSKSDALKKLKSFKG